MGEARVTCWHSFELLDRVAAKIFRALYGAGLAARGENGLLQDSLVSAKVALIGIDRSIEALATIAVEDDDPRLELLQAQLRRLRREVDARFPLARAVVRPGLDCPAAATAETQAEASVSADGAAS